MSENEKEDLFVEPKARATRMDSGWEFEAFYLLNLTRFLILHHGLSCQPPVSMVEEYQALMLILVGPTLKTHLGRNSRKESSSSNLTDILIHSILYSETLSHNVNVFIKLILVQFTRDFLVLACTWVRCERERREEEHFAASKPLNPLSDLPLDLTLLFFSMIIRCLYDPVHCWNGRNCWWSLQCCDGTYFSFNMVTSF